MKRMELEAIEADEYSSDLSMWLALTDRYCSLNGKQPLGGVGGGGALCLT